MSSLPKQGESKWLENKLVTITGYIKNTKGIRNIEYTGENVVGVCTPGFWKKYARDKQKEKSDTSWSIKKLL